MRRFLVLALSVVGVVWLAISTSAVAQFGGMAPPGTVAESTDVTVLTVGGNQVSGMLPKEEWKIKTDELGTLEVPTSAIASIEFGGDDEPDVLRTKQNSSLKGHIEIESIAIDSEFGTLSIERSKVKAVLTTPGGMGMGGMGMMMPGMAGAGVEPKQEEPAEKVTEKKKRDDRDARKKRETREEKREAREEKRKAEEEKPEPPKAEPKA